jgi:cytochrome P450
VRVDPPAGPADTEPVSGVTPRGRCPVHESFDPLAAGYLADPLATLAALPPDERPVFYAPAIDYYVVTRHADIERVFRDHATYSAAVAQAPLAPLVPEAVTILLGGAQKPRPSMVSLDDPEHARLRKPAARAFTARRVSEMAPRIRAMARELLDAVDGHDPFDLVPALAFPLPAYTIFSMMGVPVADFDRLKRWCGYRAALSWGRPAPEEQVEIAENIAAYRGYLRDLVEAKHGADDDDLTCDLLAIHDEDPERLTRAEIASILFSLSFAGHETTTYLIGNIVRRLLERPETWAELVRNPAAAPAAVEETLRFDTSVPVWRRVTTRATTLGGVDLPYGAKLFLWLAAAGRDPAVFTDPERFDPGRSDAGAHLAFGRGLHYCLGANLGRLEAAVALEELLLRYPALRLVDGQAFTYHPNISFRGPQSLWVTATGAVSDTGGR